MPTSDSPVMLEVTSGPKGARPKFWSESFFEQVADSLNKSPVFAPIFKGMKTRIVAESTDQGGSFMINIVDGAITVRRAEQGEATDFRFSAPYAEWVSVVRDGSELRGEVVKGRVKFKGSMPMMLLMLGKVSKAEKELVAHMRAMEPEY
ncbi:MAG: SCP2 sterol-binding domain-containing protein [Nitrososphaerota archaeon]|nr:SCP2 sterol-binding domain-containing protein [Nitrososphaerota archaeon]